MTERIDTITLADGTIIDTSTGKIRDLPVPVVAPTASIDPPMLTHEHEVVGRQRRPINNNVRISELGATPRLLTPVAVVLSLTMIGVSDAEICSALSISPSQLLRIRGLELYDDCRSRMLGRLREAEKDSVRQTLYDASQKAVEALTSLVNSSSEKIQLAAANSVLDRTGHKAADVIEHKHSIDGEMRIRIIDDMEERDAPIIEISKELN